MSNSNAVWNITTPQWARETVCILKDLDAADSASTETIYDGKYLGVDLKQIARRYVNLDSAKRSSVEKLLASARELRNYVDQLDGNAAQFTRPLELAMLESVKALLEGREPDLRSIPGFSTNYIAEEFLSFTNAIQGAAQGGGSYRLWQDLLTDCRLDLFITTGSLVNTEGAETACVFR